MKIVYYATKAGKRDLLTCGIVAAGEAECYKKRVSCRIFRHFVYGILRTRAVKSLFDCQKGEKWPINAIVK